MRVVYDYKEIINFNVLQVTWMDEKTRKAALEKLETIVPFIAYPDELKDSDKLDKYYRSLEILEDNYLKSRLNLKLFDNAHEIKRYREPVNKTDWVAHGYSAVVNAFYNPSENSIRKRDCFINSHAILSNRHYYFKIFLST